MAVHAAGLALHNARDYEALAHVKATLLLGDGDRVRTTKTRHFGSAADSAEGVRASFTRDHDVVRPSATADICNDKDIVCDFAPGYLFRHAGSAIKVHTHYYNRTTHQYAGVLTRAARWAASLLSKPAIIFDGRPQSDTPPSTLGPYAMSPFGADPDTSGTVRQVPGPAGAITFDHDVSHTTVGDQWATWSNGYLGDVYYGDSPVTITLPSGTRAFYFYAEPNQFEDFDVSAVTQNGTTSGMQTVYGDSGAKYFGFYATGSNSLRSITVSAADEIAVGEFGISR